MRERLLRKGYNEDQVQEVLSRLKEAGLIDDLKFAKFWINYRLSCKLRSISFIKNELKNKGVDPDIIEEALAGFKEFDEKQAVRKLAEKKIKAMRDVNDPIARKRRLYAYLGRRGFSLNMIREVVDELLSKN